MFISGKPATLYNLTSNESYPSPLDGTEKSTVIPSSTCALMLFMIGSNSVMSSIFVVPFTVNELIPGSIDVIVGCGKSGSGSGSGPGEEFPSTSTNLNYEVIVGLFSVEFLL